MHPFSKKLDEMTAGLNHVDYYEFARPQDLKNCLSGGYDEVLIMAHTLRGSGTLGYLQQSPDGLRIAQVLDRPFHTALADVQRDKSLAPGRIRLLTCNANAVLDRYPSLKELTEIGITNLQTKLKLT